VPAKGTLDAGMNPALAPPPPVLFEFAGSGQHRANLSDRAAKTTVIGVIDLPAGRFVRLPAGILKLQGAAGTGEHLDAVSKLRAVLTAGLMLGAATTQSAPGTVIVNARVADGTGAPLRQVNVRIVADRITQVGEFKPEPGERIIDARKSVLAPGFIDIHNHSDDGLEREPLAPTQISQGITTVILGLDGGSPWPIGAWLDARRASPAALNLAMMVGHATVRQQVMGEDYRRTASAGEVERMAQLVDQGMSEGAIGLSSGVEYDVASYSATDELVALSRVAAKRGGFYMTHIRDEADKSFEALQEEIVIGESARIPVEHSHIKLGTVSVWGKAPQYIRVIEAARARGVDFLADCYPYDAWLSTIKVLVPNKQYEDPKSVEQALADVGGASHVTIVDFAPNRHYENRTIEQLAREAGVTPIDMYIRIIREGDQANTEAAVIGQSMVEADIKAFYQQPWVMVSSDGGIGAQHPRGAGTFPRVLGQFVREKKWLTLPEAIRKMTSLPAQRLGWKERGTIREGAYADLVLFNPDTVIDRATFAKPMELSTGIEKVFVNGVLVWSEGQSTQARPGRVLSKSGE
jgi:N-acyl-D-amino-acid deacylase